MHSSVALSRCKVSCKHVAELYSPQSQTIGFEIANHVSWEGAAKIAGKKKLFLYFYHQEKGEGPEFDMCVIFDMQGCLCAQQESWLDRNQSIMTLSAAWLVYIGINWKLIGQMQ